jgi:hypothetical protein
MKDGCSLWVGSFTFGDGAERGEGVHQRPLVRGPRQPWPWSTRKGDRLMWETIKDWGRSRWGRRAERYRRRKAWGWKAARKDGTGEVRLAKRRPRRECGEGDCGKVQGAGARAAPEAPCRRGRWRLAKRGALEDFYSGMGVLFFRWSTGVLGLGHGNCKLPSWGSGWGWADPALPLDLKAILTGHGLIYSEIVYSFRSKIFTSLEMYIACWPKLTIDGEGVNEISESLEL